MGSADRSALGVPTRGSTGSLAERPLAHAVGSQVERCYARSDVLERRREACKAGQRWIEGPAETRYEEVGVSMTERSSGVRIGTWNTEWAESVIANRIQPILDAPKCHVLCVTEGYKELLPSGGHVIDGGKDWGYPIVARSAGGTPLERTALEEDRTLSREHGWEIRGWGDRNPNRRTDDLRRLHPVVSRACPRWPQGPQNVGGASGLAQEIRGPLVRDRFPNHRAR